MASLVRQLRPGKLRRFICLSVPPFWLLYRAHPKACGLLDERSGMEGDV